MKAVFFFCLNSMGLFLVHTQTRRPNIAPFTSDCKLTKAGHEYAGPLNVTRSGRTCQQWNSDKPHFNYYKENTFFPEGSAAAAGNKCRNPDRNYSVGVFCYTTSPNTRWDHCDVGFCECRLQSDPLGVRYEGQIRYTRSGRQCRSWYFQTAKPHPFNESIFYPDASVAEARNYCRNPNASRSDGPWCFTNDPNIEWEYCLIPVCNFTSPVFPTKPQNSTILSQTSSTQTRSSSTRRTTPSSAMDTRSIPPSPTNPRSTPMSTTNPMTLQPRTTPASTRRSPSTKLTTRTVVLPTQLPVHESSSSIRESSANHIVKIVIPIVGVIALICIIVAIIVWKRTGLVQSSWKRFLDGRSPPRAEGNEQRSTVIVDAIPRPAGSFDNPLYAKDQQPLEISGVTKDHSSTDSVTITDSGVAYMSMDNVRLS